MRPEATQRTLRLGVPFPSPRWCAVLMIIADLIRKQPPQLVVIQSDHVIEQVSAAALDPALPIPFCQGLSTEVRTHWILIARTAAGASVPYLASRSTIGNREANS